METSGTLQGDCKMNDIMPFLLSYYNAEIVEKICRKYGLAPMDALRKFLSSQTYQMLTDKELEMWDFSPNGIFDMWENEQITGDPRNSLYLRRDKQWKMHFTILTDLF